MKEIQKHALLNSLLTAGYIVLISLAINLLGNKFPGPDKPLITPIAMLLLFVFSAALTGFLVFGKPILWYLDGRKKQAVSLLLYTLAILFALVVISFIILFLVL